MIYDFFFRSSIRTLTLLAPYHFNKRIIYDLIGALNVSIDFPLTLLFQQSLHDFGQECGPEQTKEGSFGQEEDGGEGEEEQKQGEEIKGNMLVTHRA